MYKLTNFFILSSIVFLFIPSLWGAQTDKLPIINSIGVHFNKFQNASEEAVRAHIKIYEGQEYDQTMVSESIRALYSTSLFESIRIQAETLPDNKINIIFVLDPKPRILSISIDGNKKISSKKLFLEIKSQEGGPLDESMLNLDILAIKEFYNKHGFPNIEVCYEIVTDVNVGKVNICFKINEGVKTRIKSITFCGHEPCKARHLRRIMSTKRWSVLSLITGKGRFQEEAFYEDMQALCEFFRNEGYLDVEITDADVEITNVTPSVVCININIRKGRLYRVGKITISNNNLFPVEKLCPLLAIHEGDIFSPLGIEVSETELRNAYGQLGYLDTYALAERKPNIETGAIDLDFVIREGDKVFLETIKIQGNTKTKSTVIIRELALAPGDVFDLVRMQNSQKRLQNTQFFEDVNLLPEDTNIPGRRNLLIAVKEGKTGNLQFGVTFSSLELFVGSVEMSQSNFDITNYRHGFLGAGQKFRIRGRLGKKTNQIDISFEEPWVCERELAFGVNLFTTESKYLSDDYNELRQGLYIYLRKRLFGLVDGQLSYMLEQVDISNVSKDAPRQIKEEKGKRVVSKVGLAFTYDTRDEIVYPNVGTNLSLNTEVAGGALQGQINYVRIEGSAARWIPLSNCANQVLLLGVRSGTIMPYGGQSVPFFDRFFLGGPETLRGFAYREVGPKSNDPQKEPIGGNTFARFTAEYTIRVMDQVRLAAFYDWGFVNKDEVDWSPNAYNDDWGVGLRVFILNAPLRLDWGFPIKGDGFNDKKKWRFNFSFGTTF